MASPEDLAIARAVAACLAVAPPGRASCLVCCAGTGRHHAVCRTCTRVARRLGHPLVPVTPVSLVVHGNPLYRALRQYKSGEPGVARRQASALAVLLGTFLRQHLGCVAPSGVDAVAVVPSLANRRPPPHPLAAVAEVAREATSLPSPRPALHAGTDEIDHGRPSPGGFRCDQGVSGQRVLLLDDLYTTGAHLQSAALALRAAGALSVHAVVVGRHVAFDRSATRHLVARAISERWLPQVCARCAPLGA